MIEGLTTRAARIARLAIGATLLALAAAPAQAERTLERFAGQDLPGGDYRTLRRVPLGECESACLGDTACKAFTYNERARWCFLKNTQPTPSPYAGATSAIVRDSVPADALPLPDLAFLPSDVATEAARLEAQVAAANRTGQAIGLLTPTAANGLTDHDADAWLSFARTLLGTNYPNWSDRVEANRLAGAAAYLAIRDATTPIDQGRALAALSRALERQNLFRPAIEAAAASVTLNLSQAEVERLETLRRNHGFRVLDYSVDADTQSPRMCIQFSEGLKGEAADLERFVSVDSIASPTLSVDSQQLCVEGLSHGGRYDVTLREGLPSTVGETLPSASEYRIYVRDRSPIARFESNRYVLPASAKGVPVTTINTAKLELTLYRINDRNLADVVRSGDFKSQLWPYQVDNISDETGAVAWKGTMDVASVTNEEVTTLFPVDSVLTRTEPGVYVLTAVPAELANRSEQVATQWFVISDIGLSTFSSDGTVDVFVRSLRTAAPSDGVEVTLLARNDEVLATATTDADGHARLVSTAPISGGQAPAVVTARTGDDYAFLSLVGGAFELTDRGVAGRTAPGPVDAFLATERGVYRAGETVHATVLVRDDTAVALSLPVTLKLTRPDGVLSRRIAARADDAGGVAVDLPLTTNAATGTWELTAHIDPEGPAVGTTTFLVEDFVPQRIAVDLTSDATTVDAGGSLEARLAADFLYGAPAADLMIEGSVTLRQAAGVAGFEGYRFGLDAEPFTPERVPLFNLPRTGPTGRASFAVPIPEASDATGALEARVAVSVREPGGRQVADTLTVPVETGAPLLGVKPNFADDRVREGAEASFNIIALDGARARTGAEVEWTLTRIVHSYQWYRRDNSWFYDATERLERVASGTATVGADAPAKVSFPTSWGRYRFEVVDTDNGAVATSTVFSSGWVSTSSSAETPDVLEVHLDKESYAAGETAHLRILPRHAGRALVTVLTGSLRYSTSLDVPAEGAEVALPVRADWAPGAYVAATLFRPADVAGGPPLPQRAVGIAHLAIDTAERRLDVAIDVPEVTAPRQTVSVPVTVTGLAPGETAHLTVAAVDVGILNLTRYEAPDPTEYYLGQRRLAVELRDLYGDLIDAGGAPRGRIRSGGDGIASGTDALPPTEEPVSLFTGVIETDADGTAHATFDVPAFNGTLRVMAIAWNKSQIGNAAADMVVRDPVVVAGSLPRFLAPGDATRMRFDLHNVSGPAGDYTLSVTAAGPIALEPESERFTLAADERTSIEMPLSATGTGEAAIVAHLTGPDGIDLASDYTVVVRPAATPVRAQRRVALAPGNTTTLGADLLEGYDTGASATVSIGSGEIDTAGLVMMLDRFPYGCAEQTVSRALPLLYLNEVAASVGLRNDADIPARIETAIERVVAFQSAAGGFGLWSPGYDMWLTAYVMDFLTRAREAGYQVPRIAFENGLNRLQSTLSYIGDVDGQRGAEIAYATYVLARNGRAAIGDLRYFAEEKLDDFPTGLSRAQLAASLALSGDQPLADRLFQNASFTPAPTGLMDYGTPLRDAAAIVTLAAESRVGEDTVAGLSGLLDGIKARDDDTYSTQEAAWLLLSANATRPAPGSVTLDGAPLEAPLYRALDAAALDAGVTIGNSGTETVAVAATVAGTPLTPLPATESGLTITRTYHGLDGVEVDPSEVAQNTRLVVRLTVQKTEKPAMRIMLTDLLPAGFEIENPRLVGANDVAAMPMASVGQAPEYTEFRDDRFAAAWTLSEGNTFEPITVSYMVRAITPGTFTLPAAEVSDMYQPQYVARTGSGFLAVTPTR
ncbi:alpha-2-macroglobulin family protein [Acuticoccus mangrovi]|uniref:Alpha-2-macroglobulin family protein n=1 Tax=Acuticoccus mangrovi TaxID=2796142 RepID=A0A934IR89_9HYPH|nr:alpha-2-macroglobulin family protein [Acuticoccus mangrovi]MBJ3777173.1 alpha-2-macroglobulin family protein [Acuticoccus mangrovi]